MIFSVQAEEKSYDVVIEAGALREAGKHFCLDRRVLVVTDSGVPRDYAETIRRQAACGYIYSLPEGEAHKDLAHFEEILVFLMEHDFTRKDAVVSVGGGVVGDLAAFAASCYMRGIDYYSVPTTLAAQGDASIGGKTAADLRGAKNLVGTFWQPKGVLVDPDTLKSLPERQLHAGLAEVLKHGLIGDAALFECLERTEDLENDLPWIIERSLQVKRRVIEADPREEGLRKCLNFGHTLGHGLESAAKGRLLHGEAVALGMIPMCAPEVRKRLLPVLLKYGLPVTTSLDPEEDMFFVRHDKKKQSSGYTTVFVPEIGSFEFREMQERELRDALQEILRT
ncbi:MAG: 3-dehydroquinate synthase [Lachnospiraceae bacterium]|nr:3-dehydroquinate synthase [Lachnospiraceae bacterium]